MWKHFHNPRHIVLFEQFAVGLLAQIACLVAHGHQLGEGLLQRQSYHGGTLLCAFHLQVQVLQCLLHGRYDELLGVAEGAVEVEDNEGFCVGCHVVIPYGEGF